MTDDVDEFVPGTLHTFAEKDFRNIATDDLDLSTEEEKKDEQAQQAAWQETLDFLKQTLTGSIVRAELSYDLGSHPVCLTPEGGMSFEMEKYFKRIDPAMAMAAEKVLQINPKHPALEKLRTAITEDRPRAEQYARLLYAQGLILADLPIENAAEYTDLVCGLF